MFRIRTGPMASDESFGQMGAFQIPSVIPGRMLSVIAANGDGWSELGMPGEPWEHASVKAFIGERNYVPTWSEMCQIKDIFWDATDCVMQFHVPKADHINDHAFVLHLWRPAITAIPLPPKETV